VGGEDIQTAQKRSFWANSNSAQEDREATHEVQSRSTIPIVSPHRGRTVWDGTKGKGKVGCN